MVESNLHDVHLDQGYSFFWDSADKSNEHTPQTDSIDTAILPFERTHWLFMAQYLTVSTFKDWSHREATTINALVDGMDGFTKDEQKSVLCNGCMKWSLAKDWSEDYRCSCGASMMDRLLHAFLYQELKLTENTAIVANKDEEYFESFEKSVYFTRVELVDSVMSCENSVSEPTLILSYGGAEFVTSFIEKGITDTTPPMVIGINGLSEQEVLDELDELMSKLNTNDEVRASLFAGLSVNHMVHCEDVGLIYIENLSLKNSERPELNSELTSSDLLVDAA